MNSSKVGRQVILAAAALAAGAAWGHPNHADPGTTTTLLHLLTEPDHLLVMLAAIFAVFVLVPKFRRGRIQRKKD